MASNLNHIITMTEAVQTLEPSTHRYKRGDVREDGLIFWAYTKRGKNERWLTRIQFDSYKSALANYRKTEKAKSYKKDYKKNNRERINKKKKEIYDKNRVKIRTQNRKYYQENKLDILRKQKQYYKENKFDIIRRQNIYCKNKRKSDELFALQHRVGSLIRKALVNEEYTKKSRTHEILGCSLEFFKNYIEQRFLDGMTWENRSEWHLDHIIPVSSATTEKEIIKLNHYTNFRPLWAEENIAKGNKQNKQLELIK